MWLVQIATQHGPFVSQLRHNIESYCANVDVGNESLVVVMTAVGTNSDVVVVVVVLYSYKYYSYDCYAVVSMKVGPMWMDVVSWGRRWWWWWWWWSLMIPIIPIESNVCYLWCCWVVFVVDVRIVDRSKNNSWTAWMWMMGVCCRTKYRYRLALVVIFVMASCYVWLSSELKKRVLHRYTMRQRGNRIGFYGLDAVWPWQTWNQLNRLFCNCTKLTVSTGTGVTIWLVYEIIF